MLNAKGKLAIFGLLVLPVTGVLYASQEPTRENVAPPPKVPDESANDMFVETWAQIQEDRARAVDMLGKQQQFQAILAQVRTVVRRDPESFVSAKNGEDIPELYLGEIAQYLISIGVGPGDLPRDRSASRAIIQAAERAVTAGATLEDKQLLAQQVVRARPIAVVADERPEDPYNSTVTFLVEKSIKGDFSPGQEIAIRMTSDRPGNARATVPSAGEFVLFLSSDLYRFNSARMSGRSVIGPDYLIEIFAPYFVSGNQLIPMGEGKNEPTSSLKAN